MTQKIHAFTNDALGDLDAVGIAERIRNKDVSAREVAEAAIARAKCVEDKINAIDVSTLPSGAYVLKLGNDRTFLTESFIKQ